MGLFATTQEETKQTDVAEVSWNPVSNSEEGSRPEVGIRANKYLQSRYVCDTRSGPLPTRFVILPSGSPSQPAQVDNRCPLLSSQNLVLSLLAGSDALPTTAAPTTSITPLEPPAGSNPTICLIARDSRISRVSQACTRYQVPAISRSGEIWRSKTALSQ